MPNYQRYRVHGEELRETTTRWPLKADRWHSTRVTILIQELFGGFLLLASGVDEVWRAAWYVFLLAGVVAAFLAGGASRFVRDGGGREQAAKWRPPKEASLAPTATADKNEAVAL